MALMAPEVLDKDVEALLASLFLDRCPGGRGAKQLHSLLVFGAGRYLLRLQQEVHKRHSLLLRNLVLILVSLAALCGCRLRLCAICQGHFQPRPIILRLVLLQHIRHKDQSTIGQGLVRILRQANGRRPFRIGLLQAGAVHRQVSHAQAGWPIALSLHQFDFGMVLRHATVRDDYIVEWGSAYANGHVLTGCEPERLGWAALVALAGDGEANGAVVDHRLQRGLGSIKAPRCHLPAESCCRALFPCPP
mmetsp:Transcript_115928/g.247748  ORF Transcript_115928/g.247748 Transcript_115928/m.247748 type:complete len:248 (-) Transcript_115928:55-798(-)